MSYADRDWEDLLSTPPKRQRRPPRPTAAQDFAAPYEAPVAPQPAIAQSSRTGKAAALEDERLANLVAAGAWESGQDYPQAAFPFVSVQGLEDTYRLNRLNQCSPISGDATLRKAYHLLY